MLGEHASNYLISPCLTIDYAHDFENGKQESLSGIAFSTAGLGSAMYYGIGATAQLGPAWNVYATFIRNIALHGKGATGNEGMVGVRFIF